MLHLFLCHLRNLLVHVDVFPEQNPIDSGKILQTIQRIDYLISTYKL